MPDWRWEQIGLGVQRCPIEPTFCDECGVYGLCYGCTNAAVEPSVITDENVEKAWGAYSHPSDDASEAEKIAAMRVALMESGLGVRLAALSAEVERLRAALQGSVRPSVFGGGETRRAGVP